MTVTPTAGPPPAMAGTRQQGFPGSPPMTGTMRVQDGAPSPSVIITTPRPSPSTPVFSNGQSEPASGPIAVPMPPVEAPARVTQPTAPSTEVPPRATAETPVPPIPAARSSLERPETPSPGARSSFEEKTGAPLAARPEERAAVAPRSSTLLSSASVAARQAMMTQTFLPPSAASQETPRETPRETVVAPREGGARDAGSRDAVNADIRRQVTEARDKYDPTAAAPPRVARQPTGNAPMVQFSAAPSEAAANALWSELLQRFPGMLSNHEPIVIRVERGNSVFWRLRTEAGNPGEARTLCSRLRAAGQDCFIPTL